MTEGIFGLLGVFVGAALTWFQNGWTERKARRRHARYLAIRVVCALDTFVENCTDVVLDDGLDEGQRDENDFLVAQVEAPSAPAFPADLDWKVIDHDLMYRLLSLPSETEAAERRVSLTSRYDNPPDFEEFFEERQKQYAKLGLAAIALSQELRKAYGIPNQQTGKWNAAEELKKADERLEKERRERRQRLEQSSPLL